MSGCDSEFVDVGKKDGLCIWRIENFKLIKQKQNEFGSFFTGDSYLVLHTVSLKNKSFQWNIHFWLGADSSIDEYATAAIKAVELDTYLGSGPVQYREVQMHESKLFHSYFEKYGGIRYLIGGVKSGLYNISDIKVDIKLFMVKGKKEVRIIQVPVEGASLNKSDSFILEDGLANIYIWNPPGTNRIERLKADFYAKKIRDDEHSGKGKVSMLEDDWDTNEDFWRILKCKPTDVKEKSEIEDTDFEADFRSSKLSLYRVSDNNSSTPKIDQISNGTLKREMLDSKDCFIVDAGKNGIFSWIGKKCTKNEKIAAINGVKEIMIKNSYPNYYPMSQCIDGGETTTFKSLFSDWI